MLEFDVRKNWIVARRQDGKAICIILEFNGNYEPNFQVTSLIPDELRQIADKLDELNKVG